MHTRQTSWLWKLELLGFALSALAILAFRLHWLPWRPALLLFAGSLATIILIGFSSPLILFIKLRAGQHRGAIRHCLFALLLSLPVLLSVLALGTGAAKRPPIHDISTDTVNPPALTLAGQQRSPSDNSTLYAGDNVAAQQQEAYPDIAPLTTKLPPEKAYTQALSVARSLGWQIEEENPVEGIIQATDRSRIFGFVDDIVIRISPLAAGSRVDIRSASRVGVSDLGVNAKRIQSFISKFGN